MQEEDSRTEKNRSRGARKKGFYVAGSLEPIPTEVGNQLPVLIFIEEHLQGAAGHSILAKL
jgi:hypothetical protein